MGILLRRLDGGHEGYFTGDDSAAAGGCAGERVTVVGGAAAKSAPDKIVMTRVVPVLAPVAGAMYENASIIYLKPGVLDHDHVQQIEAKLKGMPKQGTRRFCWTCAMWLREIWQRRRGWRTSF